MVNRIFLSMQSVRRDVLFVNAKVSDLLNRKDKIYLVNPANTWIRPGYAEFVMLEDGEVEAKGFLSALPPTYQKPCKEHPALRPAYDDWLKNHKSWVAPKVVPAKAVWNEALDIDVLLTAATDADFKKGRLCFMQGKKLCVHTSGMLYVSVEGHYWGLEVQGAGQPFYKPVTLPDAKAHAAFLAKTAGWTF